MNNRRNSRNFSNRNRSYRPSGDFRRPSFHWRLGRIRGVNGGSPSAPLPLVEKLNGALVASFGHGVARVVCDAICFPPFTLPPLYAVGTRRRVELLWSIIDRHGDYCPARGFVAFGACAESDDLDAEVIDCGDSGFVAHDLPPVETLYAAADIPPDCLLATAQAAICLPPVGGYQLFLRVGGDWRLVHGDMPAFILQGKAGAVYPDLLQGVLPQIKALPEPDDLSAVQRRVLFVSLSGGMT